MELWLQSVPPLTGGGSLRCPVHPLARILVLCQPLALSLVRDLTAYVRPASTSLPMPWFNGECGLLGSCRKASLECNAVDFRDSSECPSLPCLQRRLGVTMCATRIGLLPLTLNLEVVHESRKFSIVVNGEVDRCVDEIVISRSLADEVERVSIRTVKRSGA